jgi:GT2 family glycosyltransferase
MNVGMGSAQAVFTSGIKESSITDPSSDISIVIVNWRSYALLSDCLASIAETVTRPHDVLVVDNSQDSRARAEVERTSAPNVRWLTNRTNKGFAAANNQAIQLTHGKLILLLNPDTILLPETIDSMVEAMDAQPQVGVLGCQLLNRNGTLQTSAYSFYPSLTGAFFDATGILFMSRMIGNRFRWQRSRVRSVAWVKGACLLVRRELLEQVGLLDDRFFMYAEDADLCYRIRKCGKRIAFMPSRSIVHLGQGSAGHANERALIEYYGAYAQFVDKHYGPGLLRLRANVLAALLCSAAVVRMVGTLLANKGVVSQGNPRAYWHYLTNHRPSIW